MPRKNKVPKEAAEESLSLARRIDKVARELETLFVDDNRAEGVALALGKLADAVEDIEIEDNEDE